MHYPRPSAPTPRGTVIPRTLTPVVNKPRTPVSAELTKLVPVTSRTFLPGWTCSTHVCPAANPRETPAAKIRDTPKSIAMTKDERRGLADANFERMTAIRNALSLDSKTSTNESPMWTVVNRYAPEKPRASNDPAITLVFSHATGFHKEASATPHSLVDHLNLTWTKKIWETTVRHLISAIESNPLYSGVDEIWALDAANHGDSALLNKSNLGDIFEWSDHARDILNFMINYLPESIEQHGVSLQPLSASAARQRRDQGFKSRTVIGIGHSFGGCTLARAVIDSPSLFSSIMLVDPVIYPSYAIRGPGIDALTKGALARRDHWPDREAAKAGLLNSPFFKAWDPEVLDDYVRYGMYEHEGQVWLKCSGFQEAATFSENSRLPCEVWELLPSIPERIPLKWVMDSTVGLVTGGSELTRHTVWRRPANSSNLSISGAGHLASYQNSYLEVMGRLTGCLQIPQEAPHALAREILDFIQARHGKSATETVKSKL